MKTAFQETLQKTPEFKNPQQEIEFLRSQLDRHVESYPSPEQNVEVKERVAQDIVSGYVETPKEEVLHESLHMSDEEIEGVHLKLAPEQHDTVINDLFTMMLERGIKNTLDLVAKMNNPHIEDDFHRFLVQYLSEEYEVPGLKPKTDLGKSLGLRMFEILLPIKKEKEDFTLLLVFLQIPLQLLLQSFQILLQVHLLFSQLQRLPSYCFCFLLLRKQNQYPP